MPLTNGIRQGFFQKLEQIHIVKSICHVQNIVLCHIFFIPTTEKPRPCKIDEDEWTDDHLL